MISVHHHATADYVHALDAERAAAMRRVDPDLTSLVGAASAGNQRAWDALVRRFQPHLLRVARAQGLDAHEAEDAVQDAWVRLMRNIGNVREPRALGGWLTTTTRHESSRRRERTARETPTAEDQLGADVGVHDECEAELDLAAARVALDRALDRLPARHRRLMRALFAEGAPEYQEIARDLDMPIGSIGPIRSRCLDKLRHNDDLRPLAAVLD